MDIPPVDSYLLLYELAKGRKPYQPTSSWGTDKTFKKDDVMSQPKKFIPDTLLINKPPAFRQDKF